MKQQPQKLRGLLMILAIAVLALATVLVSQKLSTQQSVSPNAPESEPLATEMCGTGLYCVAPGVLLTGGNLCDKGNGTLANCCCKGQTIVGNKCSGTCTPTSSGSGGGSCSRTSAANCQGKSDGDSCGSDTCVASSRKGTDGKKICTCGENIKPSCPVGYTSNGKCEAGLRPVTISNCCVK